MRMTRAEAKEHNRRALLDAALEVVSRDGHRAKLDDIAERAGLTTGAVYSLFGSKAGLVRALVSDQLEPYYAELTVIAPAELGLVEAVEAFARDYYRRNCRSPNARSVLALQITLLDMAVHDPELGERVAASVREQEARVAGLFAGRRYAGGVVGREEAWRIAVALRGALVGLSQGVVLGLVPEVGEAGGGGRGGPGGVGVADEGDVSGGAVVRDETGVRGAVGEPCRSGDSGDPGDPGGPRDPGDPGGPGEEYFASLARALVSPSSLFNV